MCHKEQKGPVVIAAKDGFAIKRPEEKDEMSSFDWVIFSLAYGLLFVMLVGLLTVKLERTPIDTGHGVFHAAIHNHDGHDEESGHPH